MLKLMIADDEAGIRRGLRQYVDWGAWDIRLVAEAADGEEAYRLALQERPDILLSDIRMPGKDGLTLAKELREVLPSLRVILLTGYNETEYLQAALKLGVKDYLLKPAGAEHIIEAVLKVKGELIREEARRQEAESRNTLLSEGLPILQMHFMDDLLHGRVPDPGVSRRKAEMLHIPLDAPWLQTAILRQGEPAAAEYRSDRENAMDFWQLTQQVSLVTERRPGCFFTEWEPDKFLILAGGETEAEVGALLSGLCGSLAEAISLRQYPDLAIGMGSGVQSPADLPGSYNRAVRALNLSAWDRARRVFVPPTREDGAAQNDLWAGRGQLMRACVHEEWARAGALAEKLFAESAAAGADFELLKTFCGELLTLTARLRGEEGGPGTASWAERAASFQYGDELKAWVLDALAPPGREPRVSRASSALVRKAQDYAMEHYGESITLHAAANAIFVSPNYLGRIFREQTGCKFGDWLNRYRVERAKELLLSSEFKTYEVAARVGFSSYKYFSVCFLKYAGCSAREYQARAARSGG